MRLGHLLKDLDEETNLDLGGLLEQRIEGGGSLSLTKHAEPLLDSAQFILELLVQGCGCHFFQSILVRLKIVDPFARRLVESLGFGVLLCDLRRIQEDLGGWADPAGKRRVKDSRHVGRCTKVMTWARTRIGGSQRSAVGVLVG